MTDSQSANSEPESNIDLDAILAKWRWLVPADVDVRIKWADLESGYAEACIQCHLNRMVIRVHEIGKPNGSIDFDSDWGYERDVEADVVHELLHWKFHGFTPGDADSINYQLWEGVVEYVAQTFLKLSRSNQ